jgi:DNA-directed RNA polymerase subunit K/omega
MIYMDLEKIYRERNIPNKYILTLVVAARARQLSERKGAADGYEEKFITRAVDDVTAGRVSYDVIDTPEPQAQTPEAAKTTDEPVEAQQ